jgi:hypothetical protein
LPADNTRSGQHQHALLNLANFHYSTGGMDSAKSVRPRTNVLSPHSRLYPAETTCPRIGCGRGYPGRSSRRGQRLSPAVHGVSAVSHRSMLIRRLLQRLNVEMSSSNGPRPRTRKGTSVPLDTLPKHVSATDELWSLRAALDMVCLVPPIVSGPVYQCPAVLPPSSFRALVLLDPRAIRGDTYYVPIANAS